MVTLPDGYQLAKKTQLKYVRNQTQWLNKKVEGDHVLYLSPVGDIVSDADTLERIKKLGIPPAWQDVRVSPDERTHIQAVGWDAKGRKQYRYHHDWVKLRQSHKFAGMVEFGELLPVIRHQVKKDLQAIGLSHKKVMATIVWMLENTMVRIGNHEYAKENQHFGITTLRDRHVSFSGEKARLEFIGKSGVEQQVRVTNPRIVSIIKQCQDIPGYSLFQYYDEAGNKRPVKSEDVNNYLYEIVRAEITAKDFRTWGGTRAGAAELVQKGDFITQKEASQNIIEAVKSVAKKLGNKPATTRKYYIHPRVIETYQTQQLIPHFSTMANVEPAEGLSVDEQALITLIAQA